MTPVETAKESLAVVLHFANAKPTESTWQRIVLFPTSKLGLTFSPPSPKTPTMSVRSCAELDEILTQFRAYLGKWAHLESPYSAEAETLMTELRERSNVRFTGFTLGMHTKTVVAEWDLASQTFSEMLYSSLLVAFQGIPYDAVGRCDECGKFFFNPSTRKKLYCSKTCQTRASVRRFRERTKDASEPAKKPKPKKTGAGRRKAK